MPPWVDYDQEQRRADRLTDLSRSAFVIGAIALIAVAVFSIYMFWPSNG